MKRARIISGISNPLDFSMSEMELDAYQRLPLHYHSNITDTFYVIAGEMHLSILYPTEDVFLKPGDTYTVTPHRPHSVANAGAVPMHCVLLQGFGSYDYVLVPHLDNYKKDII